jgi:hypothetical protein
LAGSVGPHRTPEPSWFAATHLLRRRLTQSAVTIAIAIAIAVAVAVVSAIAIAIPDASPGGLPILN